MLNRVLYNYVRKMHILCFDEENKFICSCAFLIAFVFQKKKKLQLM